MLNSGAGPSKKSGERGILTKGRHQLHRSVRIPSGGLEYRFTDLVFWAVLTVGQTEPENRGMEVDPCLQIGHRDSDMINREQDHPGVVAVRFHASRVPDWL